ncbi:hypothetical protein BgiBS90_009028, partial [Biomphalaria glabrata]
GVQEDTITVQQFRPYNDFFSMISIRYLSSYLLHLHIPNSWLNVDVAMTTNRRLLNTLLTSLVHETDMRQTPHHDTQLMTFCGLYRPAIVHFVPDSLG